MLLEWDLTVRFYVRETFLAMNNQKAFDIVTHNVFSALPHLVTGSHRESFYVSSVSCLPREVTQTKVRPLSIGSIAYSQVQLGPVLFPLRHFHSQINDFPHSLRRNDRIRAFLELSLAKLSDMDRHIANGEVLGVSLLVEDVLGQEVPGIVMNAQLTT